MKAKKKFILDIVPLTRIPLNRNQSFSYLSDKELGAGTLVSVPLFKRNVEGIVFGSRPDFPRLGNIELKKIGNIIEENFLDQKQLELARFISEYYFSPLGIALKFFVPKRVKSRKILPKTGNRQPTTKDNVVLTKEQQEAVDEIATNYKPKAKSYYLFGPSGSGKTEVYINAISNLKVQNPKLQFLILLPELTLTPQAVDRYGQHFDPKEIAVLHSKIAKGKFYADWQRIRSGEAKIIIGSRMAVFAPFRNLGLIIIDEEQDISFKQWDMNPRYDARNAAEKIAELHGAKMIFGSATPSIEYFHRAKSKKMELLKLPELAIPGQVLQIRPEIEVADLRKERWEKNYSSISKKLRSELTFALKNKAQAILFVSRQGMSNFSVCADCKSVLKCPKCERALVYDREGFYRCLHCSYQTSITPRCEKCSGLNFSNIGVGTQKVEREVSDIFPGARIARADNQTLKGAGAQERIYRDFSEKRADILIGTQVISKGWDLPSVSLIGIIDADNLLSVADFNAEIKAYQSMIQAAGRAGRPGSKFRGTVIIQTFEPNSPIIKAVTARDFEKFYEREIKGRKNLSLPPFGKMIKLIFQDANPKKTDSEAERVFGALSGCKGQKLKIYGPQEPLLSRIRGRWRKQIVLKFSGREPAISAEIRKILNSLPAGWIIDADPISIV